MRTRNTLFLFAASALLTTAAAAQQPAAPRHASSSKPATTAARPAPKVSADSAKRIVLANIPDAKIKSEKLRREGGRRVYVFSISQPKGPSMKALVDAESGDYTKVVPSSSSPKKDSSHKATKPAATKP